MEEPFLTHSPNPFTNHISQAIVRLTVFLDLNQIFPLYIPMSLYLTLVSTKCLMELQCESVIGRYIVYLHRLHLSLNFRYKIFLVYLQGVEYHKPSRKQQLNCLNASLAHRAYNDSSRLMKFNIVLMNSLIQNFTML